MALTIRDARAEDAGAVAALLGQLGYPAEPAAVRRRIASLQEAGDLLVVAEAEGTVVGLASIHVSPSLEYDAPAAKLSALAVDEGHRGRGVGRALVAAIETEARVRGCVLLFLTSAERRNDAHAFYERIGFAHTGRRFAKTLD